jgi:hypothetical protein
MSPPVQENLMVRPVAANVVRISGGLNAVAFEAASRLMSVVGGRADHICS